MSGIKIQVTADLVSNLSEQVRRETDKVKKAPGGGSAKEVNDLARAVENLDKVLSGVSDQGLTIDTSDANSALAETLDLLNQIGAQAGASGAGTEAELNRLKRQLEQTAKAQVNSLHGVRNGVPPTGDTPTAKRIKEEKRLEQQLKRNAGFASRVTGGNASPELTSAIAQHSAQSRNPIIRQAATTGDDFEATVRRLLPGKAADRLLDSHERRTRSALELEEPEPKGGNKWMQRAGGVIGGATSGALSGGGGMASMAAGSIGAMAGAIPGIGVLLGPMVGAAAGAIASQIGDAFDMALKSSNLSRAMGDTSTSFEELQRVAFETAKGTGLAGSELGKLADQYARTAGMSGKGTEAIVGAGGAAGFARGFGADPSSGVNFFAQMRLMGNTRNDKDQSKLAVNIAEAIATGKNGAKTDEVLSAIAGFAQQATHMNLGRADVSSFAYKMANGSQMGVDGLTAERSASILSGADASMRGGGAAGDASKILIRDAISRGMGRDMTVFESAGLNEGGFFASPMSEFGPESARAKMNESELDKAAPGTDHHKKLIAERERLQQLSSGPTKDIQNYVPVLEAVERNASGISGQEDETLKNMFGTRSQTAARALKNMLMSDGGNGRLKSLLPANADMNKLMASGSLAGIAEVSGGDEKTVKEWRDNLLTGSNGVTASKGDEVERLSRVSGDTEAMRKEVISQLSVRDMRKSSADEQLAAQKDIKSAMERMAGDLIPLTNKILGGIESGISALVGHLAPQSDYAIKAEAIKRLDAGDKPETPQEIIEGTGFFRRGERIKEKDKLSKAMQAEIARRDKEQNPDAPLPAALPSLKKEKISQIQADNIAALRKTGEKEGLTDLEQRIAKDIYKRETDYGANKKTNVPHKEGSGVVVGQMQMLDSTFKKFADKDADPSDPDAQRTAAVRYIKHLSKVAKDKGFSGDENVRQGVFAGYLGGEGKMQDGGKIKYATDSNGTSTTNYMGDRAPLARAPDPTKEERPSVASLAQNDVPIASRGMSPSYGGTIRHEVVVKITDEKGRERAKTEPIPLTGAPVPAGRA